METCSKGVFLEVFKSLVFTGLKKAPHLLIKTTVSFEEKHRIF
jgi:hypothetical protein